MGKESPEPFSEKPGLPDLEVAPGIWLRRRGTDNEYVHLILPWDKFERVLEERNEQRLSMLYSIDATGLDPEVVFDVVADQVDAILVLRLWTEMAKDHDGSLPKTEDGSFSKIVELASRGKLRLLPDFVPPK